MSATQDAMKLVKQKIQRCQVAFKRADTTRLAFELGEAARAAKELAQLLTDAPKEATDGR